MLARRVKTFAVAAASLLLLCGPRFALADRPRAPHSYTTLSQNKEFEFVMNAPGDTRDREKRKSGLYRQNGSTNPLWTVTWYSQSVIVSSDGVHLIREGPWASSLDDEALSFLENGKLIREYRIKDLLTTSEGLQHSTSHFWWLKHPVHFDDTQGLLSLTTLTGDEHIFDVAKGKLIHSGKTTDRLLKPERVTGFDLISKTIQLDRPEGIIGLTLPAGTEVKIPLGGRANEGGRIDIAVLHERVNYRGISMDSGTTLRLVNKYASDRKKNPRYKADGQEWKDDYADMMVLGASHPSDWQIGPLRIRGGVVLREDGDTHTVECYGTCVYDKFKVLSARFGPGLRLKGLAMVEGEPLKILVGTDLLHGKYGAQFWSTGNLRELTLEKEQKFLGMTVIDRLRFWSNGKLQEATMVNAGSGPIWERIDPKHFCKNGVPKRPFGEEPKAESLGYLEQCDDGSILFVKQKFLCDRSDWVRKQLPFLLERPPGRFKECDELNTHSIGATSYKVVFRDIEW